MMPARFVSLRWLALALLVQGQCSMSPAADPPAQRVRAFRASDPPPQHDEAALAAIGIHKYSAKRMALFTDLDPGLARTLPPLVDQAYDAWIDYFGLLLPDQEGSEFFITGYLMVDQALFRESGLLPNELPPFPHGRNQGTRFWMNDQSAVYYRRHLLLHEATHCFMTTINHPFRNKPWYMEGMAELFGTHSIDPAGQMRTRVLPDEPEPFRGWGRLRLMQDEVAKSGPRERSRVFDQRNNEYLEGEAYAWSWGLCQFLDGHPRYRERFQKLGRSVTTGIPATDWNRLFADDQPELDEEWLLFAANACLGYDLARAAVDFRAGDLLPASGIARVDVVADRGWQSSKVLVEKGKTYQVTASGRFVIAHAKRRDRDAQREIPGNPTRRPWESEPQGISFRYHDGRPLGMLVGAIRSARVPAKPPRTTMLDVIPIGPDATFVAAHTGTLYLRLNDDWNSLSDNAGEIAVEIRQIDGAP